MTSSTKPSRVERATDGLLVLIVLAVGLMAASASFHHVHDWTMHNSPTGTAGWFGWANAVITELIPTAALIIIARRRKHHASITYPMFLLITAVGLSLTAQLAVARPTVFGWMVSALPALAFFALSKLVFTATKGSTPASGSAPQPPAPADADALASLAARLHDLETRPTQGLALTPATSAPAPSPSDIAPAKARPVAKKNTPAKTTPRKTAAAKKTTPAKAATPAALRTAPAVQEPSPIAAATPVDPVAQLLPGARIFADAHHAAHGEPINPGQLAVRMQIDTATAKQILDELAKVGTHPTTAPHNGTKVEVPA